MEKAYFRGYAVGVGAGAACDLLIFSGFEHAKIKRSQPSAAPTERAYFRGYAVGVF
jgi:ribosome modulation factor